ncbi:hypothetical protein D020_0761B, partial [Vibrio parahaemolyticus SBR10290]
SPRASAVKPLPRS